MQWFKIRLSKHFVLYIALGLIVLVLLSIMLVKPRLEKHTGWVGMKVKQELSTGTLVVCEVLPGSPAEQIGVKVGDHVLSCHGIAVSDVGTLRNLLDDSYINQLVRLILDRNGKRLVADIRVAKRPKGIVLPNLPITIPQGSKAPHADRGLCVNCHNIRPNR